MLDLQIGSQEWRANTYATEGVFDWNTGFISLSTRCGISAPGRSEGMQWRMSDLECTAWIEVATGKFYRTRADAAQAAWEQREPWDGLFVGQYFLSRLNANGSITMIDSLAEPLSWSPSMGEALAGYAA